MECTFSAMKLGGGNVRGNQHRSSIPFVLQEASAETELKRMTVLGLSGKTMQQYSTWRWTTAMMRCCWTGSSTQVRKSRLKQQA